MNSYLVYKSSKYVIAKLVSLLLQSVYESDVYKLYRYCLTNSCLLISYFRNSSETTSYLIEGYCEWGLLYKVFVALITSL